MVLDGLAFECAGIGSSLTVAWKLASAASTAECMYCFTVETVCVF